MVLWIIYELYSLILGHGVSFYFFYFIFTTTLFVITLYYHRQYRSLQGNYQNPVSIVIPVYREQPWLFKKCLSTLRLQANPPPVNELIVVFDGQPSHELLMIAKQYATHIETLPHRGKRHALTHGIRIAKNHIVVTIDSDTYFEPNCIHELVKPFSDPMIGAIGSDQEIFQAATLQRRFANYFEAFCHRFIHTGESVRGHVGCLFGRCIAVRKPLIEPYLEQLETETFLGKTCIGSSDRFITDAVIHTGHTTNIQLTAKCYTDTPPTWKQYVKQQLRWLHGSKRSTFKRIRWMMQGSLLTTWFYTTHLFLPLLTVILWTNWGFGYLNGHSSLLIPISGIHAGMIGIAGAILTFISHKYILFSRETTWHHLFAWLLWINIVMVPLSIYALGEIFIKNRVNWATRGES